MIFLFFFWICNALAHFNFIAGFLYRSIQQCSLFPFLRLEQKFSRFLLCLLGPPDLLLSLFILKFLLLLIIFCLPLNFLLRFFCQPFWLLFLASALLLSQTFAFLSVVDGLLIQSNSLPFITLLLPPSLLLLNFLDQRCHSSFRQDYKFLLN